MCIYNVNNQFDGKLKKTTNKDKVATRRIMCDTEEIVLSKLVHHDKQANNHTYNAILMWEIQVEIYCTFFKRPIKCWSLSLRSAIVVQ